MSLSLVSLSTSLSPSARTVSVQFLFFCSPFFFLLLTTASLSQPAVGRLSAGESGVSVFLLMWEQNL